MAKAKKSSQKSMVDGLHAICRTQGDGSANGTPSYAKLERSRLIRSGEISAMFGMPAGWFGRHRTRKPLEDRGFPKSVVRGRWLRTAVEAWLEREGTRGAVSTHRAASIRVTRPAGQ